MVASQIHALGLSTQHASAEWALRTHGKSTHSAVRMEAVWSGQQDKRRVSYHFPMSGPAQGALSRESDGERALSSWVQAVKAKVEASYPGQSNVAQDYYRL